jgi:hypothetical protein
MLRTAIRVLSVRVFVLGAILLVGPCGMLAQHGGGHGGGMGGSGSRPGGVQEKDDLKDFHRALAMQATSQQVAEYAALLKSMEEADAALQSLEESRKENKVGELPGRDAALDETLEEVRSENKEFLNSFSRLQKSGLKDITKKLLNADSELAKQAKIVDQKVGEAKGEQIASSTESLGKALTNFRNDLLSLGKEMSIVLPAGEGEAFELPPVQNSVIVDRQPIAITASGKISKVPAEGGQNVFKLEMVGELSDLQQKLTALLRSELDKFDPCGERIAIRRATLSPSEPASLVVAQFHFERWACERMVGRETVNEIVEGDGTITVKLTPGVEKDGSLRLAPEIVGAEASGVVGDMLRSGSLGETLREKIARAVLSAIQQGIDFKATLPPSAQGATTMESAKFENAGLGNLNIVLNGEIRMSDEQVKLLASQIKERASAQKTVPH